MRTIIFILIAAVGCADGTVIYDDVGDAGVPAADAASPGADAGPEDAGPPPPPVDAGSQDGGVDAGPPPPIDAGSPDAGPPDAGPPDAGPPDAGPPDAGPPDAGPPDAGPPDAGPPDAGPPDAGFDPSGVWTLEILEVTHTNAFDCLCDSIPLSPLCVPACTPPIDVLDTGPPDIAVFGRASIVPGSNPPVQSYVELWTGLETDGTVTFSPALVGMRGTLAEFRESGFAFIERDGAPGARDLSVGIGLNSEEFGSYYRGTGPGSLPTMAELEDAARDGAIRTAAVNIADRPVGYSGPEVWAISFDWRIVR
jgi:hypothetical protein